MTLNRKKATFRGHFVSHERKFRGHLKKSWAKSSFFEGQGKPCLMKNWKEFLLLSSDYRPSLCMHMYVKMQHV